jgi:hypothetical protein
MIIDEKELQRRLNSTKNLSQIVQPNNQPLPEKGPIPAPVATPEGLRILGASLVAQGVPEHQVSRELNVPVRDLKPRAGENDFEQRVQDSIDRVRELALSKMVIALGLMTPDKFESASLKDLTAATANLSKVLEKTSDRRELSSTVQFVVHVPPPREMGHYQVIDI